MFPELTYGFLMEVFFLCNDVRFRYTLGTNLIIRTYETLQLNRITLDLICRQIILLDITKVKDVLF